ncbi:MAG: hypothetical protein DWQ19_11600 [Crenarchaeota archaeon]|nr:MAG: hypothetical protein DWQ19_11600 [Thermoproteota archaeon]
MLKINLVNIEDTILKNKDLRQKLPELMPYVDIWEFAVRNPSLKGLRKQAALDYLNALGEKQIDVLIDYFNCPVTIDKLDNQVVRNFQSTVENLEEELKKFQLKNMVCYREGTQVYISSWK